MPDHHPTLREQYDTALADIQKTHPQVTRLLDVTEEDANWIQIARRERKEREAAERAEPEAGGHEPEPPRP